MVDVAERARVSLKTVSRVVNREPRVAGKTAARVQRAIEALGFRRHDGAAHLRRGSTTASLGLVLMDVADPFYSTLARAVEEVAQRHRFLVLAGSSNEDLDRERELVLALSARRVDGLLVVPAGSDQGYLEPEVAAGTPVVFIDRPGVGVGGDAVLCDNAGGVRTAIAHLAGHGHRRIGFLGDAPTIFTARERLRGFREGVKALSRTAGARPIAMGPHTLDSIGAALERFRSGTSPITAIVTGNNRITLLALRALSRMGGFRPAMVGFDDLELADLLHPALTVIAQDASELGRHAAELLFARIAGDRRPEQRIVLPVRLIARGSGETAP